MILILGVTGTGKGRLAFDLAETISAEIISIDSMKVYRRMDIGTAKPPSVARQRIKYHLIDVVEPSDSFSVAAFLEAALHATEQIKHRDKPVIAVGGTALYIKALLYGLFEGPGTDEQIRTKLRQQAEAEGTEYLYRQLAKIDPVAAERIDPNDSKRIIRALEVYKITGKPISSLQQQWKREAHLVKGVRLNSAEVRETNKKRDTRYEMRDTQYDWTIIGLRRAKADTNSRINKRVKKMIAAGLVDEVKSLLAEDKPLSQQARCAIGYAEIIDYLNGQISLEDATELIKKNTRRLAKNQRTWFKTFENINWLDIDAEESAEQILTRTKTLLDIS